MIGLLILSRNVIKKNYILKKISVKYIIFAKIQNRVFFLGCISKSGKWEIIKIALFS